MRRLVTILRREAAAGVSAALLHFADVWCAAVLVHHEDRAAARVTTVFRSAPGQLAASFSDPSKRSGEIGPVMVFSYL